MTSSVQQKKLFVIGGILFIATLIAAWFAPRLVLSTYLAAWLFLLSVSLGALANLMIHALTGGPWGDHVRPTWIAGARLLPWIAIGFLPVLFGLHSLYAWTERISTEIGAKAWWLNSPFFIARSIVYLAIWTTLGWQWLKMFDDRARRDLTALSAGGLIVLTLTISLAAIDWIASLVPVWYSSGFGLIVAVALMLGAMAFAICVAGFGEKSEPAPSGEQTYIDLGNLLMTFVMTWAYLAFMQFLIIWAENIPKEVSWYVPRLQTGWQWLALFLVIFYFAAPTLALLSRRLKRSPRMLALLAAVVLVMHFLNMCWLILPSLRPDGIQLVWTDALAPLALGILGWALWNRAIAVRGVTHE